MPAPNIVFTIGWRPMMFSAGPVQPSRLRELFAVIEPEMYRYPAIDLRSFRAAVGAAMQ